MQLSHTFVLVLIVFKCANTTVIDHCRFVRAMLQHQPGISVDELNKWTCIAQYQSNFDTSLRNVDADGISYYGMFQISEQYWCSRTPYVQRACNVACNRLQDDYFADDFQCLKTIYSEHLRIYGDGFSAWPVYNAYCQQPYDYVRECVNVIVDKKFNYGHNVFLKNHATSIKSTALHSSQRKAHKIYERCELARELYYVHNVPFDQVASWVCIANYESSFNTSAVGHLNADGSSDHGLFQISDIYWCSPPGRGWVCGLSCAKLENADITDDVECMMKIYKEHQRLSGNGFNAWAVYPAYCQGREDQFIAGCFESSESNAVDFPLHQPAIQAPPPITEANAKVAPHTMVDGKVYKRCELAQELRYKHNVPKDQIHTWVCLAQQLSSLNSSAIGPRGARENLSYGLFQISEQYWCSQDDPSKGCATNCLAFIDHDLTDDVQCVRQIFEEHQRVFGNGFHAWSPYESYCKYQSEEYTKDCFDDESSSYIDNSIIPEKKPTSSEKKTKIPKGKVYERCELAKELRYKHNISQDQISTWVCITQFHSNFVTSATGMTEHGLFQVSDQYWCALYGSGKGCGISCADLEDSDITDDIECAQKIYAEHQRLYGDGFQAWSAYEPYCKGQADQYTRGCFPEQNSVYASVYPADEKQNSITVSASVSKGKVYERCELARELRTKHNMPKDQIHMWVCIAQHESNFDTSAVGRLNADGSGDHGIFQISDIYWCSIDGVPKACGKPCSKFEDSDIRDDVQCVRKIHAEHERLFGNGFSAWTVYEPYCKHQTSEYTRGCFEDDQSNQVDPPDSQVIPSQSTTQSSNDIPETDKSFERCELAKELRFKQNVPKDQIGTWVCIALYQSNFVTSALGPKEHGLFQINEEYWCSTNGGSGKGCGLDCSALRDADITDDVQCVRRIFNEHQTLSGDGFQAWSVYQPYCKGNSAQYIKGCFADDLYSTLVEQERGNRLTPPKNASKQPNKIDTHKKKGKTNSKVYQRCELARELRYTHNIPLDQVHTWLCIAQQQSKLNTSALGPANALGIRSYGLFQISNQFWCSDTNDNTFVKGCNVSCLDLLDDQIANDVQCIRQIFNEHKKLYGNGFHAWTSYDAYCKYQSSEELLDCFENSHEISNAVVPVKTSESKTATTPSSKGKVYGRCELAQELRYKHNIAHEKLHIWVCIAKHESNFNTTAISHLNTDGSSNYGLFQISDSYWCSNGAHEHKACRLPCSKLIDSNITDDIECSKKIYDKHKRFFGNGFHAWAVYEPHCRHLSSAIIDDCFSDENVDDNLIPQQSERVITLIEPVSTPAPKVYAPCELAKELHHKHSIPMEQIATWVCIAKHESTFNTSAVGHTNDDGSGDHGLFQISDVYWCSPPGNGWSCGLSCASLEDTDITDDVECIKKIYNEHQQLSGDGFNAWKVYAPFCKGQSDKYIAGCFDENAIENSPMPLETHSRKSSDDDLSVTKPTIQSTSTLYNDKTRSTVPSQTTTIKPIATTTKPITTTQRANYFTSSTTPSTTLNVFDLYLKRYSSKKPTHYTIPTSVTTTTKPTKKSFFSSAPTTQRSNRLNTYRIPDYLTASSTTAKPTGHRPSDNYFQNFFNTQVAKISTAFSYNRPVNASVPLNFLNNNENVTKRTTTKSTTKSPFSYYLGNRQQLSTRSNNSVSTPLSAWRKTTLPPNVTTVNRTTKSPFVFRFSFSGTTPIPRNETHKS